MLTHFPVTSIAQSIFCAICYKLRRIIFKENRRGFTAGGRKSSRTTNAEESKILLVDGYLRWGLVRPAGFTVVGQTTDTNQSVNERPPQRGGPVPSHCRLESSIVDDGVQLSLIYAGSGEDGRLSVGRRAKQARPSHSLTSLTRRPVVCVIISAFHLIVVTDVLMCRRIYHQQTSRPLAAPTTRRVISSALSSLVLPQQKTIQVRRGGLTCIGSVRPPSSLP